MEPPGTAPGSEPIITGAFIAIDRVAPIKSEYKGGTGGVQGRLSTQDKPRGRKDSKRLGVGIQVLFTMVAPKDQPSPAAPASSTSQRTCGS